MGGVLRRDSTHFRLKNMWLKEKGFKNSLKKWWMRFGFKGSYSFIMAIKI